MLPAIRGVGDRDANLARALLRGRYMAASAKMEWNGVPIDAETLGQIRAHWVDLKTELIEFVDAEYEIFEGASFSSKRFERWLVHCRSG